MAERRARSVACRKGWRIVRPVAVGGWYCRSACVAALKNRLLERGWRANLINNIEAKIVNREIGVASNGNGFVSEVIASAAGHGRN